MKIVKRNNSPFKFRILARRNRSTKNISSRFDVWSGSYRVLVLNPFLTNPPCLQLNKMDFGELKNDTNFVTRVTDFDQSLEAIKEQIQKGLAMDQSQMSKEDRIKHELFLSYSMNTLYFLYLKINGVDINDVCRIILILFMDILIIFVLSSNIPLRMNYPGSDKRCSETNNWKKGRRFDRKSMFLLQIDLSNTSSGITRIRQKREPIRRAHDKPKLKDN